MFSSFFSWGRVNDPASFDHQGLCIVHDLPVEILYDIFSRLETKYVLRCRSVCRSWKALISTQDFARLHDRNNSSTNLTLLVESQDRKLYSFDGWRETESSKSTALNWIRKFQANTKNLSPETELCGDVFAAAGHEEPSKTRMLLSFSSCGYVVFLYEDLWKRGIMPFSYQSVILNPITNEKVKIIVPDNSSIRGQVYGLFFHPVLKEFCIIWGQIPCTVPSVGDPRDNLEFKLLNFGPSPSCWRSIVKPSKHHPRLHLARGVVPPVVLDDVLYWMVGDDDFAPPKVSWPDSCQEAILAFDIKREEFDLLPHPGPCCKNSKEAQSKHLWMQLLEFHGTDNVDDGGRLLSLCAYSEDERVFNIWNFKKGIENNSFKEGQWIKKHVVKQFRSELCHISPINFLPVGLVDGELLVLSWVGVGLFVHNLKLGTSRLFATKKWRNGKVIGIVGAFAFAHTHSFSSIRNCYRKPEIFVET